MVKFDDLRISGDGDKLTVECHVENYDVYSGIYIQSIYLDYYKNRTASGYPSEKAIKIFENNAEDPTAVRAVRKTTSVDALPEGFGTTTFKRGLFYVYVTCDGNLPASVAGMACGFDVMTDLAVVPDWRTLYEIIMPLVAKYASSCTPCDDISGFGHFILMWYAFKFAVDTCDWNTVDRIWDELIGDTAGVVSHGGCGCFNH